MVDLPAKILREGKIKNAIDYRKGSLFFGRMTNLFDGVSLCNPLGNTAAQEEAGSRSIRRRIKGTDCQGYERLCFYPDGRVRVVTMANNIEKMIATTFMEMAEGLETGSFGKRPKIALTGMGSEHGEANAMEAAVAAAKEGIDVYYIGTLEAEGVTMVKVANDEEGHKKMEELLKNKEVDGAVTIISHSRLAYPLWGVRLRRKGKRDVCGNHHRHFQR